MPYEKIIENHPIGLICPKCGKKWVRANVKLRNLVCRNCGFTWVDKNILPENELKPFVL